MYLSRKQLLKLIDPSSVVQLKTTISTLSEIPSAFAGAGSFISGVLSAFGKLTSAIGVTNVAIAGFIAVAAGIAAVVAIVDALTESFEEAQEKSEESRSKYESTKSELENVNSELETTQERMSELQAKGGLTFVEQAELEKLEAANEKLLTQEKILAKMAGIEQEQAASDANDVLTKEITWQTGELEDTGRKQGYGLNKDPVYAKKTFTGDIIDKAESLNDRIEQLYEERQTLQEKLSNYAEEDMKSNTGWDYFWNGISDWDKDNAALTALDEEISERENEYADAISVINTEYPSLFDEDGNILSGYEDTNQRIMDLFGITADAEEVAIEKQAEFDELVSDADYTQAISELTELAKATGNVGITADDVKGRYPELVQAAEEAGFTVQDIVDQVNSDAGIVNPDFIKSALEDAFTMVGDEVDSEREKIWDEFSSGLSDDTLQIFYEYVAKNDIDLSAIDSIESLQSILSSAIPDAATEAIDSATKSFDELKESADSVISSIEKAQSVLSSQQSGKTISYDDFTSDELADYQAALENNNGTLQLNAEKVQAIAEAKAEEEIATISTNKAQAQYNYLLNSRQIEKYRQQLQSLGDGQENEAEKIRASISALEAQNSSIADTCAQYDVLSASIQEAVSAYQGWLDAQSGSDYGDMADDVVSALQRIQDTYNEESDLYGQFGSKKFDAAVELAVPDSVDKDDISAINAWKEDFAQYLNFDDDGNIDSLNIDQFLTKAAEAGLMSVAENADGSKTFEVLGQKSMEDFAEGLNMSAGMIQAFFDELQLYNGDFKFDSGTVGDMIVEAGEAANALWAKDESLKIVTDVSDFDNVENALSTLDSTIDEMNNVKAGKVDFDVDTSDIENANSVIEYCVAQKQLLTAPAVMSVDTSQVTGDLGTALSLLQQFQNIQNQIELAVAVDANADTSSLQAELDAVTAQIQQPEIAATLGLDSSATEADIQAAIDGLDAETIVSLGVDSSLVSDYQASDLSKDETVTYHVDDAEVAAWIAESHTADGTVIFTQNTSNLTSVFYRKGYVTWYNDSSSPALSTSFSSSGSSKASGTANVSGTAYASGTARAKGNWGTAPGGKTLVGELGKEIVVLKSHRIQRCVCKITH